MQQQMAQQAFAQIPDVVKRVSSDLWYYFASFNPSITVHSPLPQIRTGQQSHGNNRCVRKRVEPSDGKVLREDRMA